MNVPGNTNDSGATLPLQVDVASDQLRPACLMLLFSDDPQYERLRRVRVALQEASGDERQFAGLLAARRGQKLVGTVWGQLMAGSSAIVWPPRIAPGEPPETADRLLQELHGLLRGLQVQIVQAVLEPADDAAAQRLERSGYQGPIDLLYLLCDAAQFPESPPAELEFEPYEPTQWTRIADLVEATYAGTRDVPLLNGRREIADVLTGYQQTGVFDPSRWRFVRFRDHDVGCLLLADFPGLGQCELVYMGLVPEARGRGWGLPVVRFAQWLTRTAGRERLVLAVDAENQPAIRIYARAGFTQISRRMIYLRWP